VLTAGDHTFDATAIGYEPSRQVIKVNGGDDQTATFTLVPLPSQPGVSPPPAAAAPPPAAVTAQPAVTALEAGANKPRGLRLYAGGLIGVAGKQSFDLEVEGYTGSLEGNGGLLPSYGLQAGATFFTVPYFDGGAEIRLAWGGLNNDIEITTPGVTEQLAFTDTELLLVDLDLKPRLRFLANNQLELYVAAPFGLTIPSVEDVEANIGWNIGVGAGINYFFSQHVGLNAELLFVLHNYSTTEETLDDDGATIEGTVSYSTWQPRLGINLVVAP
ncbi:MAG TPA: outer membrane beta-barrel protein, partial [Polyangiales bacterium]|nr:outer membrane beta-barrel protein [Polyangiales bacterium]